MIRLSPRVFAVVGGSTSVHVPIICNAGGHIGIAIVAATALVDVIVQNGATRTTTHAVAVSCVVCTAWGNAELIIDHATMMILSCVVAAQPTARAADATVLIARVAIIATELADLVQGRKIAKLMAAKAATAVVVFHVTASPFGRVILLEGVETAPLRDALH